MLKATLIALLSLCLLLAGCTTTRTIALTSPVGGVMPEVATGDTVVVTLKSGEVRRMKVESVDATTLTGRILDSARKGTITQLALTDVQSMRVTRVSGWRTGGLAVGVVVAVAVVALGTLYIAQCGTNGDCDGDD
jgi:hypothetical protein